MNNNYNIYIAQAQSLKTQNLLFVLKIIYQLVKNDRLSLCCDNNANNHRCVCYIPLAFPLKCVGNRFAFNWTLMGSWTINASCKSICVFPTPLAPYISVIPLNGTPPFKRASILRQPVLKRSHSGIRSA